MFEKLFASITFTLFDMSLKAILIWIFATFATRIFHTMSVHSEHRVWTIALLALLMFPILPCVGPTLSVPLGNWWVTDQTALSEMNSRSTASMNPETKLHSGVVTEPSDDFLDAPKPNTLESSSGNAGTEPESLGDQSLQITTSQSNAGYRSAVITSGKRSLTWWTSITVFAAIVWLIGVSIMSIRLMLGICRAWKIRRSSQRVADFPTEVALRESDQIQSPVVVGWCTPCILLPTGWREWTPAKRSAVISHETSHLQRHDPQLTMLAEFTMVLYWFHPVAWWTKAKLSRLAELACDEFAAIAIGDRIAYARHLVDVAMSNQKGVNHQPGIAMARNSEISTRVQALLDLSKPLSANVSWRALALMLLVGLPAAMLLAALHPTLARSDESANNASSKAEKRDPAAAVAQKKLVAAFVQPAPTDIPVLTLRGTALMPDGSIAKDAILETVPARGTTDVISAAINKGQFEVKTTGTKLNAEGFLIRTPDWSLQATLRRNSHTLRTEYAAPIKLALETTKIIRVKVVNTNEKPVADSHVQVVVGSSFCYHGKTHSDGVSELQIPQSESVFLISAWTDDHKTGGLHVGRAPTNQQLGTEFQIEISHAEPIRARAVDELQQPVANVPLEFVAVKGKQGEFFIGSNPTSYQTTDANGEAVFEWVPDWPIERLFVRVNRDNGWREPPSDEPKKETDRFREIKVAPSRVDERVTTKGKISGVTADVTGLLVEFWGSPGENRGSSDVVYARCDANGNFSARVLPGSNYCVNVDDCDLVSDFWDGVIALAEDSTVRSPELTLENGIAVEVRLTSGSDHQPIPNSWVHFETAQETRSGNRGHRFWGKTNNDGFCRVIARAGDLEVRVSEGDWYVKKTIQVAEGEPVKLELRRRYVDKQTIHGRLVLPDGDSADLGNMTIEVAGIDSESKDTATVKTDAQGRFTAAIAAGRISILATSKDEAFFGNNIVDVSEGEIEVPVYPAVDYEGQVLGANKQPLVGFKVFMNAWLIDHERANAQEKQDASKPHTIHFHNRAVMTDKNGRFVFAKTPQRIDLFVFVQEPGKQNSSIASRKKYFEPGLSPELDTYQTEFDPKEDLAPAKPAK